jgi:predicted MFS family arabinose efflux permease
MKTILQFAMLLAGTALAIVIGVVLGDYGAWYFSWVVGTIMIVLIAAAGGVLLDTQEDEQSGQRGHRRT